MKASPSSAKPPHHAADVHDRRADHPLNCARAQTALFWFFVGAVMAFGAMTAESKGNWASLLRVGSENPLLPQIERELGPVFPPDPVGHDGQLYYLIARDPFGSNAAPATLVALYNNAPAYRYRRILLPLLAGGFGHFSPRWTLWGLMLGLVVGMGLATVAVADLAFQWRVAGGAVVLAAVNAGALMSTVLLTVDALALGLALIGFVLALRGRTGAAAAAFACAALTKETYILVPCGLAVWAWLEGNRRTAVIFATVPTLPLVLWSAWLSLAFSGPSGGTENLGLPFVGPLEAARLWITQERDLLEALLAIVASLSVVLAVVTALRSDSLLRCLIGPWLALALSSSVVVWGKPNNAARSFAILWTLSVLGLARDQSRSRGMAARTHVRSNPIRER